MGSFFDSSVASEVYVLCDCVCFMCLCVLFVVCVCVFLWCVYSRPHTAFLNRNSYLTEEVLSFQHSSTSLDMVCVRVVCVCVCVWCVCVCVCGGIHTESISHTHTHTGTFFLQTGKGILQSIQKSEIAIHLHTDMMLDIQNNP